MQPGDDPFGAAIVSACISAHEHEHAGQAECDPNGTGVYPPENDLKCDEHESEALDAEIKCYDQGNVRRVKTATGVEISSNPLKDEAANNI